MNALLQVAPIIPEISLLIGALLLLVLGVSYGDKVAQGIHQLAIILILGVAVFIIFDPLEGELGVDWLVTSSMISIDNFSQIMKTILLMAASFAIYMAPGFMARQGALRIEYPVLAMLSCLGMMVMVSSNNFLTLYVGLELQSLALYVLAAFRRDDLKSTEAGLKYFVLGALASGFLLYGISLFYGLTGTVEFSGIATAIGTLEHSLAAKFALLFIIIALAFKISAAPFHMWAPDVYEGAPTPVTAFFAVAPKVAALGLMVRVLYGPLMEMSADWQKILIVLSAASMAVGAFGALGQSSLKRLLAYSSIGHVGFMLMGLAAANREGGEAMLVYLTFYVIMSLTAFAVLLSMRSAQRPLEQVQDLAGLSQSRPGLAIVLAIVMFSMAGIPPMVGFFTKVYVLMAAINAGMMWLAILGVLVSVVSAFYYIRIIRVMYFDEPVTGAEKALDPGVGFVLAAGSLFTLTGLALVSPISLMANYAFQTFFR